MLTRNSHYYRTKNHYSYEEKMGMIQEYLTTEISMTQMVKKYHIGWSTIPKWMRNFGIPMPNEAPVQITMSEENKKQEKKDTVETLEAKLQELQAELILVLQFGRVRNVAIKKRGSSVSTVNGVPLVRSLLQGTFVQPSSSNLFWQT